MNHGMNWGTVVHSTDEHVFLDTTIYDESGEKPVDGFYSLTVRCRNCGRKVTGIRRRLDLDFREALGQLIRAVMEMISCCVCAVTRSYSELVAKATSSNSDRGRVAPRRNAAIGIGG